MDIEDSIIELGKTISHIAFEALPNENDVLEYLIEGNPALTFDFSCLRPQKRMNATRKKRLTAKNVISVDSYTSLIRSRITAACIETDCFIDAIELYEFEQLATVYLSVSNKAVDHFDEDNLCKFRDVLIDLASKNLKKVEFDITDFAQTAREQIKDCFSPLPVFVEFTVSEASKKSLGKKE